MADGARTQQGWVPIPDPTTLTTEQLRREIERLRVELTDKLAMAQLLLERLVASNRALYEEKFRGVDKTFEERQTQFDQLVQANKDMTAQAFASAKEAVAKSDIDTDQQLEQLRTSLRTAVQNSDDKLADLKDRISADTSHLTDRLTRIESREVGAAQANDSTKWGIGAAIAIAGLLISAAVLWQKPSAPLGPAYVAPPAYYQPQASPPPVAPQPIVPKP